MRLRALCLEQLLVLSFTGDAQTELRRLSHGDYSRGAQDRLDGRDHDLTVLRRDAERALAQVVHVRDQVCVRIDETDYATVLARLLHLQCAQCVARPKPIAERLETARGFVIRIPTMAVAPRLQRLCLLIVDVQTLMETVLD